MNDIIRLAVELNGVVYELEDQRSDLEHIPAQLRSIAEKLERLLPHPSLGELFQLEDYRH